MGLEVMFSFFVSLAVDGVEYLTLHADCFTFGKDSRNPQNRRLGWTFLFVCEEGKYFLQFSELETCIVSPLCSTVRILTMPARNLSGNRKHQNYKNTAIYHSLKVHISVPGWERNFCHSRKEKWRHKWRKKRFMKPQHIVLILAIFF